MPTQEQNKSALIGQIADKLQNTEKAKVENALQTVTSNIEKDGGSINLIPAETINRKRGRAVPVDPTPVDNSFVSVLNGLDFGPTQSENQLGSVEQRILELQAETAGAAEFRADESDRQNIEGLTNTRQDLLNQFNTLRAQADAIPLQTQEDFAGRGATKGGAQPHQTGDLRRNAIQALSIGAQLQAADGNLQTALSLVDNAVNAKYQPIQAELELRKAQLEVVEARASRENSRRAEEQRLQVEFQLKDLAREQEKEKTMENIMLEAITNGATAAEIESAKKSKTVSGVVQSLRSYLGGQAESFTLSKDQIRFDSEGNVIARGISSSPGVASRGAGVYNTYGDGAIVAEEVTLWAKDILSGASKISNIPEPYPGFRNEVLKEKNRLMQQGYVPQNVVLSPEQQTTLTNLRKELNSNKEYVGMVDIANGFDTVISLYGTDGKVETAVGFDDVTAINAFQRMIDPGATVREGDVELLASTVPYLTRVSPTFQWKSFKKGNKLPSDIRKSLLRVASDVYETKSSRFNNGVGDRLTRAAEMQGIPSDMLGANFLSAEEVKQGASANDQMVNQEIYSSMATEDLMESISTQMNTATTTSTPATNADFFNSFSI